MNPTHLREGNVIREVATGDEEIFPSVNAAKRKVREIQGKNKIGLVRVVDKFPKGEEL